MRNDIKLTYTDSGISPTFERDLFITETIVATAEGLSLFMRRPVKIGLLFAESREEPLSIFDPYLLLENHKHYIRENYTNYDWQARGTVIYPDEPLLWQDGFFNTEASDFQRWFVEEGIATLRDINKRWCEEAARVIMHELPYRRTISTATMFVALRNFAPQAIANHIDAAMNENRLKTTTASIVRGIADLSLSVEEGNLPSGKIVFVRHSGDWIDPNIELNDVVDLSNLKLLRKMLTAVKSGGYYLVANERRVMGFSKADIPENVVVADFQTDRTILTVKQTTIAEIKHGRFYAALPEIDLSAITSHIKRLCGKNAAKIICSLETILKAVLSARHGCSIVITHNELSGQKVQPPIDPTGESESQLICDMAAVDGALHIRDDGYVHAFGCLLDGRSVPTLEDLARGSRYNSAVRYTKMPETDSLVIVASADGPVTAFIEGKPITPTGIGLPPQLPNTIHAPPPLTQWLDEE